MLAEPSLVEALSRVQHDDLDACSEELGDEEALAGAERRDRIHQPVRPTPPPREPPSPPEVRGAGA